MNLRTSMLVLTAILGSCSTVDKPKTIRWDKLTKLPANADGSSHIGLAGPVAGFIGNRLMIAGGANFPEKMPWEGGSKHYAKQAYMYEMTDGAITFIAESALQEPIAYSGNCSIGQALYVAGGENRKGAVRGVKKFSLVADTLQEEMLPGLPVPLTNGSLVSVSDKLYFVGGENQQFVSDKIYGLDLSVENAVWEEVCTLANPLSHAVVVSDQTNKLYIAGGRMRNVDSLSTIYDQLYEVDLLSGSVSKIADLPYPVSAGTGVWDDNGNILLFGGDQAETFHRVEALTARINQTTDELLKQTLNKEKADLQREHPGFPTSCWSFNVANKRWKKCNDINGLSPVTTTALWHQNTIVIPSGEVRAGVRTDQILVGLMSQKSRL